MFVLNAICDGLGNLTISIPASVDRDSRDCGMTIEKSEVVGALRELVEIGWAKPFKYDGKCWVELAEMPSLDEMEDPRGAWFEITAAGMKVHLEEYEGWPYDDDNVLRKDWQPPAA
jgi:hypothetical protein